MMDFADEIYSYSFRKKPNYRKLKFLLEKEILLYDEIPNNIFDWNEEYSLGKHTDIQFSQVFVNESYE